MMIRNKRAFPYQVQGLEMKLFASGEFEADEGHESTLGSFLLDKQLQSGKAYYVDIVRKTGVPLSLDATIKSCIVDFLQHPFGGENQSPRLHYERYVEIGTKDIIAGVELLFKTNNKRVVVSALTSATDLSEIFANTVIYIYEIPLLPKGSVN